MGRNLVASLTQIEPSEYGEPQSGGLQPFHKFSVGHAHSNLGTRYNSLNHSGHFFEDIGFPAGNDNKSGSCVKAIYGVGFFSGTAS